MDTISRTADADLMKRMARGEEAALAMLYDRYSGLIMSIAFGVVGDRAIAEEVALDIFLRAWERAADYDPARAAVTTWLGRLARNRAIDRLRRESARPSFHSVSWADAPAPAAGGSEVEADALLAIQRDRVRAALAALAPDQRQALALAYFQGLSHSQIAAQLNQPLGTVKGHIRAGMQRLRHLLQGDVTVAQTAPDDNERYER